MYGYVLQDWITVRGTTTTPFLQNECDWLGFSSFQDIAFWIDIREFTVAAGTLTMALQTAPTKDDVLFQTLSGCSITVAVQTPFLTAGAVPRNILSTNPAIPLSTWVRWVLTASSAGTWDCSFRILASANRVVAA